MFYRWHVPQLPFLELLKPTTEESQRGLTSALNCKEEQCDMFRMASFEGALKPFFICLKTLSHSEVSHSIRWCTGTQPPAVLWPPHSDIKPSLNLRISFSRGRHLSCSQAEKWYPLVNFSVASKARFSGAQSQHLNGNSKSVNNSGEHLKFFSPTSFTH